MNPLQTAILRHTTTDGRQHFDWLLAQTEIVLADARETLCWRCPRPLTEMNVDEEMVVQAIQNHRCMYLTLDGARCRYFILRLEGASPLCVTLAGDRLTRVAHFTNMNAKD